MPMPHRTQMQLIKRRLVGKEGADRVRELRTILQELPGYRNGPYADIRKWVQDQIEETRLRSSVVQRDSISVRREGAAQIALVGPPNAGKSSLLQSLSHIQIKIGDYAFTTLRPVPALTRIHGVLVQLVEIPGLIEGAHQDRGGGKALLGVLRGADAVVYCQDASGDPKALIQVREEVRLAGIDLPAALALTKVDECDRDTVEAVARRFPDLPITPVSVLEDETLEQLKATMWGLAGLLRVYLRHEGSVDPEPVALPSGSRVVDVARSIHNTLGEGCRGARVWGLSTRHEGQLVGRNHTVYDGDIVEILTNR